MLHYRVVTPWNLINNPNLIEKFQLQLDRYLLIISLGLFLNGIPAFYINGLIGAYNYIPEEGLDENRTINREIFFENQLFKLLSDKKSLQTQILAEIKKLLKVRISQTAFDQKNQYKSFKLSDNVLGIKIFFPDKKELLYGIFNFSKQIQKIKLEGEYFDIISGQEIRKKYKLGPYEFLWLKT